MTLFVIDIVTSVLQSIIFSYTIFYCVEEKNKITKINSVFMTLLLVFIGQFFTGTFANNLGPCIFLTHILSLAIIALFYRKDIIGAVTSYTLIYSILGLYSTIFGNLIFEYVKGILSVKYINYEIIFIVYLPQCIFIFLCFKYIKKIKEVVKFIQNEKFSIMLFTMSFILDFIVTFYLITLSEESQLLKNIIYIIFFMFFLVILIYFWKVHKKSQQIYKLNEALEIKNGQLRKIKHDYGAQISYLYGLCLMERFNDLKKSLKDIINNNDSVPTAVEVTGNEESLLSLALKPAIEKGIHVIIEEKCDFSLINMSEMEFFRVISNIVNNAIKAMNGEGIIIAKSYEYSGNAIIKIENNGPKIEEHNLGKIFKVGFTTKDNVDNSHGFGLSIVKELVENYNGKVLVKSSDTATEFKIVLPINKDI
ncbi:sensor histidine kinase CitA [Clostridium puniceum]|uniref:histidine kinase n=1 Tax=Clostridium puniceum TaxID=29367 RepID=A0A1S8TRB2_9CLOT|nr:ATP-binding protein [Clostridium puniceum]OOM80287.1 sensor histidine kinase CitA [Clostridium puniceum]